MTISQIHIIFHVPEGFEEIASLDIKESFLPFESLDPLSTIYIGEPKSGRVHLFSKISEEEEEIKQWWQFLNQVKLACVYNITLITNTTTIPINDIYHNKNSNNNNRKEEVEEEKVEDKIEDKVEDKKEKEKAAKAKEKEENELVLGQYMHNIVKNTDWQTYLNYIKNKEEEKEKSSLSLLEQQQPITTFRATFYKDQLQHSMKTHDIQGWIGYAFSELYIDWKVNLKKYDYNIVGIWGKSKDRALLSHCLDLEKVNQYINNNDQLDKEEGEEEEEEEKRPILFYVGIGIPVMDSKYRNRIHLGRTSLNPPIASCLARLADPQPGEFILDMCCGTGTIPIEGASKYPNALWIGGEVKVKTLAVKAKENMLHAKVSNVELLLSDGRLLCFRHGSIDKVVSDWPWGIREGSFSAIQKLYPKFIRQISRVLRKNGKAYIVTQGQKLMGRVLAYDWVKESFCLEDVISIGIGGIGVYIYILKKTI